MAFFCALSIRARAIYHSREPEPKPRTRILSLAQPPVDKIIAFFTSKFSSRQGSGNDIYRFHQINYKQTSHQFDSPESPPARKTLHFPILVSYLNRENETLKYGFLRLFIISFRFFLLLLRLHVLIAAQSAAEATPGKEICAKDWLTFPFVESRIHPFRRNRICDFTCSSRNGPRSIGSNHRPHACCFPLACAPPSSRFASPC